MERSGRKWSKLSPWPLSYTRTTWLSKPSSHSSTLRKICKLCLRTSTSCKKKYRWWRSLRTLKLYMAASSKKTTWCRKTSSKSTWQSKKTLPTYCKAGVRNLFFGQHQQCPALERVLFRFQGGFSVLSWVTWQFKYNILRQTNGLNPHITKH